MNAEPSRSWRRSPRHVTPAQRRVGIVVFILTTSPMAKASNLHGVDGCNGGWVVADSDANVEDVSFRFVPSVEPLFRQAGPERVIAIRSEERRVGEGWRAW